MEAVELVHANKTSMFLDVLYWGVITECLSDLMLTSLKMVTKDTVCVAMGEH